MSSSAGLGLRERSKIRRRRLILLTALRLFAERGYDRTTIADIAETADVAPRTVTGYFPSKLAFITEWPAARSARLIELFTKNPEIGFIEFVDLSWRDAREHLDREEAALTRAMSLANPGIAAMADAEVAHRAGNAPPSVHAPLPEDRDFMLVVGRAAISRINQAFYQAIAEDRMSDALHARMLDMIRTLVQMTHAGHGSLRPGQ